MSLPEYPDHFPCPDRFQYAMDYRFNTSQVQMQGGWTQQRRFDPHIYREMDMSYLMPIATFWQWWEWVDRYGFGWWSGTVDGQELTCRFISNIDYSYVDFATVSVSVRAERFIPDDIEVSDATPTIIDPLVSVGTTQPENDVAGDPSEILYMSEPPAPINGTLTSQTEYPFRTTPYSHDRGTILISSSGRVQVAVIDDITALPVDALNQVGFGVGLFWQQESALVTPTYLEPGGRYRLQLTPVDTDPEFTVEWFNQ